ncbi:hypothetical protein ACTMU2_13005, partial [Cupriavidus basilensis]
RAKMLPVTRLVSDRQSEEIGGKFAGKTVLSTLDVWRHAHRLGAGYSAMHWGPILRGHGFSTSEDEMLERYATHESALEAAPLTLHIGKFLLR